MNRFDGIEEFVSIIRAGSFSAAAKELKIPVTTISGKIRALEARLNTRLLYRTTRSLSLTQEGRLFLSTAERLVSEIRQAEESLQIQKKEPTGILRISASQDVGQLFLAPLVAQYLDLYPQVQVELILTHRYVDLISERIDLVIRPGRLKDSSLRIRPWIKSEAYLYASPSFLKKTKPLVSPKDLQGAALIGLKNFGPKVVLTQKQKEITLKFNPRCIVEDMSGVKAMVREGAGLGVLPTFACREEEAKGELVKVLPQWHIQLGGERVGQLSLLYLPLSQSNPKVSAFVELALRSVQ